MRATPSVRCQRQMLPVLMISFYCVGSVVGITTFASNPERIVPCPNNLEARLTSTGLKSLDAVGLLDLGLGRFDLLKGKD